MSSIFRKRTDETLYRFYRCAWTSKHLKIHKSWIFFCSLLFDTEIDTCALASSTNTSCASHSNFQSCGYLVFFFLYFKRSLYKMFVCQFKVTELSISAKNIVFGDENIVKNSVKKVKLTDWFHVWLRHVCIPTNPFVEFMWNRFSQEEKSSNRVKSKIS